jgi:4'-phosphopantetheinyl transferase
MNVSWPPGPRRPAAPSGEVHVWRTELGRGVWPSHELLPPQERERAERMPRPLFRDRWVASRWALRGVLGRYLGEDPATVSLRLGERGKPALAEPTATLRFNLSHSGALALIAVTEGREVGVDVEEVDPGRDVVGLAERGLDPAAAATVRAAEPEARVATFHQAWARREAAVKCLGSGLGAPLPPDPVAVSDFDAGPGYAAALAVEGPEALPHRCFSLEPS